MPDKLQILDLSELEKRSIINGGDDLEAAIVAILNEKSASHGHIWEGKSLALAVVGEINNFPTGNSGNSSSQESGNKSPSPQLEIEGGLWGNTNWGYLSVNLLAVKENLRGQGFGTKLLQKAETLAVERGCHSAFLNTFSFQAPDFYARLGYRVFGELPDFPPGQKRIFMCKKLV